MNLQGGSQNFRIISSRSQLKSDWSICNAGINRVIHTLYNVCADCGGYLEYRGGVQYRGGYHDKCGGYLEYCGGVQYHGGYHEYRGGLS